MRVRLTAPSTARSSLIALIGMLGALISLGSVSLIGAAQNAPSATICVLAFADINKNGIHDSDEALLSGANISLLLPGTTGQALIANHVTDTQGQSCFNNLTPGTYMLNFNDPLAIPTTQFPLTVTVDAGQQILRNFGALPMQGTLQNVTSDKVTILLTRRNRVILGLLGAAFAMLFMVGLGLVIYNGYRVLFRGVKREPEQIQ